MDTTTTAAAVEDAGGFGRIRLSRDNWAIRLYLWAYDADPTAINTCKLFWGFVFVVPALILGGLFRAAVWVDGRLIEPRRRRPTVREIEQKERAERDARLAEQLERIERGPSRAERALDATGTKLSELYVRCQTLIRVAGIVIGVAVGAAVVGCVVYAVVTDPLGFLAVVAVFAGAAAAVFGLFWIGDRLDKSKRMREAGRTVKITGQSFHRKTCAKVDLA